jgi:putative phosphoesterase
VKIGLIADTQGSFHVDALIAHVAHEFRGVDEIWHAGDWGREEVLEGLGRIGPPLIVVNGNAPDDPHYPMKIERTVGRWHVTIVHNLGNGSLLRFEQSLPLVGRVREGVSGVVVHAHTHRWRDELVDGTRFINPGTATKPQFGGTERTMARLRLGRDVVVEKLLVPKFPASSRARGTAGRGHTISP